VSAHRRTQPARLARILETDVPALRDGSLEPVEVALLDTGVDAGHPDLSGRVVDAFEIVRSRGRYRPERRSLPSNNDRSGHGTGVASIIAAVAPNAKIVDICIASSEQGGRGEALLAGLRLAWERRSPVLNVSLCCDRRFLATVTELCEAAYARNQVVVAAQDNAPTGEKGLPAELSSVIGVDCDHRAPAGSLRFRARHRVEFSAGGRDLAVAAPGGKHAVRTGTSFATASVAGLVTLLRGAHPDLTPFELKSVLKDFASRD
jgi:subtilisin family serine protease